MRKYACAACGGRGWDNSNAEDWAVACKTCKSTGSFTVSQLAELVPCDRDTIVRLDELRSKPETAERALNAFARLLP